MSQQSFPWRTALFVSVALNMLAIGVVVGAWGAGVRVQREAPAAVVERIPGVRTMLRQLPPPARAEVRREVVDSWAQSRALREAAAQARRDAFAAAEAEPYDVARVKTAFAAMRAADQNAVGVFHDSVAEALASLSQEERREALQAMRRAPPATRATAPDAAGAPQPSLRDPAVREDMREKMRERRAQRREQWRERLRERRDAQP